MLVAHLEESIDKERLRAARLLLVSVLGGLAAIVWLWRLSDWGLDKIDASVGRDEVYATTTFLLVRGVAYSGVVGAFLFGIFRLARSALDQATRFDKRLIALHFIRFATGAEQRITKEILPQVVAVLEAWSATVDSAYTSHDDGKRSSTGSYRIKIGKEGIEVDSTGKAA